ncbi:hypothetical protein BLNAU_24262 [Blattamonas nauphoetae]|uniref:Uncharacterized protein n=1 Tax=Blattamonas nauphoetae TaxID=2049346 RepID=A0ABQ9WPZ7_9EUKA|nr:hypothetical protein BLNAU_24262 [Blattamonas nauphoetae]
MNPALVSAVHSASNPETILSSFRETGLVPFDPNVVLRQFHKKYLPKEAPIPVYSEAVKDSQIMGGFEPRGRSPSIITTLSISSAATLAMLVLGWQYLD